MTKKSVAQNPNAKPQIAPQMSILFTATTNAAIANFLKKFVQLLHDVQTAERDYMGTGDFTWISDAVAGLQFLKSKNEQFVGSAVLRCFNLQDPVLLQNRNGQNIGTSEAHQPQEPTNQNARQAQAKVRIVLGTLWQIHHASYSTVGLDPFDVVIIDEASQMPVADAAIAFNAAKASDSRIVVCGDTLQLPPILQGSYPEPKPGNPNLYGSIMECLLRDENGQEIKLDRLLRGLKSKTRSKADRTVAGIVHILTNNFRMVG